jgi:hypothetical protein
VALNSPVDEAGFYHRCRNSPNPRIRSETPSNIPKTTDERGLEQGTTGDHWHCPCQRRAATPFAGSLSRWHPHPGPNACHCSQQHQGQSRLKHSPYDQRLRSVLPGHRPASCRPPLPYLFNRATPAFMIAEPGSIVHDSVPSGRNRGLNGQRGSGRREGQGARWPASCFQQRAGEGRVRTGR